jgi:hypothetical protein
MNRLLAVLICITLFGLVVITALTDQVPGREGCLSEASDVHLIMLADGSESRPYPLTLNQVSRGRAYTST